MRHSAAGPRIWSDVARLEYIDNTGAKAVFPLSPEASVAIGRDPASDIYTNNPSVSRRHGRIYHQDSGWLVKDLGSSNGTFINDAQIREQGLQPNDRIRCGDFVITYFAEDAAEDAAPPKRQKRPSRVVKETVRPATRTEASMPKVKASLPTHTRVPRPERSERSERQESSAPKKRIRTVRGDDGDSSVEERYLRQIKEQAAEIETLTQDRDESRSMVGELEIRLEELETKSTRYEVELDSMAEKYVQIKDQLTLSRERLDETREELAERDDQIFQLESRISELDGELESARERASSSSEHVSTFKIKLTQKERQIEDLQRQYDLMEFEFRATRDELQALQEGYNADAGDTQRLERRINQLREIIADKENVISELRLDLENKDIEIRQVKLGMGLTDLEDEKRKLLEDYYEKNREVDKLRDKLEAVERDHQETREKLTETKVELERKSQPVDIEAHPEFKAKAREVARLKEQLDESESEARGLQQKLDEFPAEERKKLQGELAFFKRKSATQDDKLTRAHDQVKELEARITELENAPPPEPPPPSAAELQKSVQEYRETLVSDVEEVYELFVQWRSNFSLFKTYLKEVGETVDAVAGATVDALPEQLQSLVAESNPGESMESVRDLMRVVASDATALKKGLTRFKKELGQ